MNFLILTPLTPRTLVPPFLGGESKLLCVLRPLCLDFDLGPEQLFSCIWTPNPWRVPGPNSRYPRSAPLCSEDLAVFKLQAVSWHLKKFQISTSCATLLSPVEWVEVIIW